MIGPELQDTYERTVDSIRALGSAVVAFSGGVDSTLLLKLAHEALGSNCVALTTVSPSLPEQERRDAEALAAAMGVEHLWVNSQELDRPGFKENPTNRCYFCKSELFDLAFAEAKTRGIAAVLYGATADDVGDHRPGMVAAREQGAVAPLLDAGLGKNAIRALSRHLNLPTWNKPAMACLSSRFPYGTAISAERLHQIEAAEEALRREGFREVRVRFHDEVARIELGDGEWLRLTDPSMRDRVEQAIRGAGFRYVALDLAPFRSGRLNEGVVEATPGG